MNYNKTRGWKEVVSQYLGGHKERPSCCLLTLRVYFKYRKKYHIKTSPFLSSGSVVSTAAGSQSCLWWSQISRWSQSQRGVSENKWQTMQFVCFCLSWWSTHMLCKVNIYYYRTAKQIMVTTTRHTNQKLTAN